MWRSVRAVALNTTLQLFVILAFNPRSAQGILNKATSIIEAFFFFLGGGGGFFSFFFFFFFNKKSQYLLFNPIQV